MEKYIEKENTIIDDFEYINNENLEEVIIKEGMTHIGERAFENCKNLKKITLPSSLQYIGPGAFIGCENLEEIVLPKGIKKIPYRCFADCKKLKRIIIPDSVKEIEWAAFTGCQSLEEITIPDSVTTLDKQVFLNCKKLKKVNLPDNYTSLPDEFFRNCPNLNIELSPKIKKLGARVFERCYKQQQFPENVTSFGEYCFKNCRGLTTVKLNSDVQNLSDGIFDGCTNLEEITTENQNKIFVGKKAFRNCKSLKSIPSFIENYNDRLFENCEGLEEITPISKEIPFACFRGCTNLKKINNLEKLERIDSYAFSGCKSLESITLSNIFEVKAESFSNCTNLKEVNLPIGLRKIGARAFFNCRNLQEIALPDTIERIDKEAFRNCHSIKEITIPEALKTFGDGAFSYMNSLKRINVSPRNKTYITEDHKILINQLQQKLVLYAGGLEDKSYSLEDYVVDSDTLKDQTVIRPIVYIGEYAFAGAKNLKELSVCGCTKDIEKTAFLGCDKLKKLNVLAVDFSSCPGFTIRDKGRYFFTEKPEDKTDIPFEHVEFKGNIVQIFPRALSNFKKVNQVTLEEKETYSIATDAFSDCKDLEEITIPETVIDIGPNAFPKTTKLKFSNGLEPTGFVELIHGNEYLGEYKLYVLDDGTYYIENNNKLTKLTKKHIDEICSHSSYIRDNPILFLDFMNSLLENNLGIKQLFNGILMKYISNENRKILLSSLKPDDKFFLRILEQSKLLENDDDETKELLKDQNFEKVVNHIEALRKRQIEDKDLSHKAIMAYMDLESFTTLLDNNLNYLRRVLKESKLIEDIDKSKSDKEIAKKILTKNCLSPFIVLLKKYNIKDQFLYNKAFISIADNPLFEEMLKVYDANTKRLLKLSLAINKLETSTQNLNDLLILMKITGALESDPLIRQQASTFICEKMFEKTLPNKSENCHRIVGDDIHRVFNFPQVRDQFDEEFATFFRENYHELVKEERKKSGFIQRVYANFREISKTSTSNKGSQRKLKVTIEKCKGYLSNVKFDGVTKKNKDFANLIGEWYDQNSTWVKAQKVHNESLNAPRNIFTKVMVDENGNKIYDNDPKKDLKDKEGYPYKFEWLPKQKYENLILGKYCNCCAHIEGAGQGIMRASMILDNCQNLIIKNQFGEIISKATLYVNKEEGYAVFNTVETSLNYRSEEVLKEIYKAFMRGANAFLEEYNKNNPDSPLLLITIGGKRNTILNYMDIKLHPIVDTKKSICYGKLSLTGYGYDGDWDSSQRLVLKK